MTKYEMPTKITGTSCKEKEVLIKGSLKGRSPFKTHLSPSPLKERGIKGVRLINNFKEITND
jgi:hypothetical protein